MHYKDSYIVEGTLYLHILHALRVCSFADHLKSSTENCREHAQTSLVAVYCQEQQLRFLILYIKAREIKRATNTLKSLIPLCVLGYRAKHIIAELFPL